MPHVQLTRAQLRVQYDSAPARIRFAVARELPEVGADEEVPLSTFESLLPAVDLCQAIIRRFPSRISAKSFCESPREQQINEFPEIDSYPPAVVETAERLTSEAFVFKAIRGYRVLCAVIGTVGLTYGIADSVDGQPARALACTPLVVAGLIAATPSRRLWSHAPSATEMGI